LTCPAEGLLRLGVPAGLQSDQHQKVKGIATHSTPTGVSRSRWVTLPMLALMPDSLPDADQRATHWEAVYEANSPDAVSWYQSEPTVSLELIDALGVDPNAAVIDVGGGASVLVDRLLTRGFTDVSVLDISEAALRTSRHRVGDDSDEVHWIVGDLLAWEPPRRYGLWHDRAVLHFLMGGDVETYRATVERAVAPGGSVVLGTFAPDGPERCSGLPVTRYSTEGLAAVLGDGFEVVEHRREVHRTPGRTEQPFTWIAARRV
jgi:SAM-dependent methyltransferase